MLWLWRRRPIQEEPAVPPASPEDERSPGRILDDDLGWMMTLFAGSGGPLAPSPDEFAEGWARFAPPELWDLLVERLKERSTYRPITGLPMLREGAFGCYEELIDAGAAHDAGASIERFAPLLAHPVGRRAAITALYAVARYSTGVLDRFDPVAAARAQTTLEANAAHLSGLTEDAKVDLCGTLSHLEPAWALGFARRLGLDCDDCLDRPLGS